jgi:hypothetical protein
MGMVYAFSTHHAQFTSRSSCWLMHFPRKYHRRTDYSKSHQQLLDALIAGNRIGLKLSKTLDMDAVEQNNARYCDGHAEVELSRPENTLPEPYKEPPLESFMQNYAMISCGRLGDTRFFIHGRELFSESLATKVFAEGKSLSEIPYEAFGEEAKSRVRRMLQPDMMMEREIGRKTQNVSDEKQLNQIASCKELEKDISEYAGELLFSWINTTAQMTFQLP